MEQNTFRCVTWNIEHCARSLAAVERVLRALAPDVAFLQEVDRTTRRAGGVDQAASLAHKLGLAATFAEAFPFDGGSYGLALLTRGAPRDVRIERLPHVPPRQPDGHGEARLALSVEWRAMRLACTHCGLDDVERIDQAAALLGALASDERVIVGGDFNEGASGRALRLLTSRFPDAVTIAGGADEPTSPGDRSPERIDFLLVSAHAPTPVRAFVGPAGASDHRPVVVDFASD